MSVEPEVQYRVTSHNYHPVLTVIALLLMLSTALVGYQVFSTFQQNQITTQRALTHAERVVAAQELVATQQEIILTLMEDYAEVAYNNPRIDRIAEQQLLAAESALTALQIIALQNSQIIELLASAP